MKLTISIELDKEEAETLADAVARQMLPALFSPIGGAAMGALAKGKVKVKDGDGDWQDFKLPMPHLKKKPRKNRVKEIQFGRL